MAAAADEEAIKLRLTNDEKALKRVAKAFYELTAAAAQSSDAAETAHANFLLELQQFELASGKSQLVQAMNEREARDFDDISRRTEVAIAEAEADIVRLREQLEEERKIREYKLQYNAEAQKIVKLADRASSHLTLRQLAEEMGQLEEDLGRAQRLLDWRGRQVRAAYVALASLQDEMGVDPTDPTRPPELYYLNDLAAAVTAAATPAGGVPPALVAVDGMDGIAAD